ncbi:MAG: hypothetical protein HN576_02900 [Bacteriovoracaceae bacterium]|jgi:anti-anti-sigma regulatory factor|nr:hypothetical protein [Bacteriovoracaceae bacterium]
MSEVLKIETILSDDEVNINIIGQIDEDSNFSKILEISKNIYILNLQEVTLINSCGVREWINFIEKIPKNSKIIYTNVPQIVVEQMNMVKGFLRNNDEIAAFYAPYYNETSDRIVSILLKTNQIIDEKAPTMKDDTGEELEFDAIEAQYFNFIKQQGS